MRRASLLPVLLLGGCALGGPGPAEPATLRVGLIADCQYSDAPDAGARLYRRSVAKLRACVDALKADPPAFVVSLGDLIDRDAASYDRVLPLLDELPVPVHHVLGNHDFEVADAEIAGVPARLGMDARYHDFARGGWRFVVLDGNDLSLHAWPAGSSARRASIAWREAWAPDAPTWNGGLGGEQLAWLDGVLARADRAGERVVLLCHYPTLPGDRHALWNAAEVVEVVDRHPSVAAWIHGHDHAGGHTERRGVHHLGLRGMVDTEETAWAVLTLTSGALLVDGRGREPDRRLPLPAGG